MLWPNAGDSLVKLAGQPFHQAYSGPAHRKFGFFAKSFWHAARVLLERSPNSYWERDRLAWPIVMLYRHAVELALKTTIEDTRRLQVVSVDFARDHKLIDLWSCLAKAAKQAGLDDDKDFNACGALVAEIASMDITGQAFRYPADKKGQPFESVPESLDLAALAAASEKVLNYLDCFQLEIDQRVDFQSEMASFY